MSDAQYKPYPPDTDWTKPLDNANHEAFALAIFEGFKPAEAYRRAFPQSKAKATTCGSNGRGLLKVLRPRVQAMQEVALARAIERREGADIMDATDRQEWWTSIMRDEDEDSTCEQQSAGCGREKNQ